MEQQKARPGLYKLQLGAAAGGTKTLYCKLTTSVGIKTASIMGVDRTFGSKEEMGKLISASGDKFQVSLSVQDTTTSETIVPHQMMARFTHLESGIMTLFAFSSKKDRLELIVDVTKEGKTLQYKSGKYNVQLLLADAAFEVRRIQYCIISIFSSVIELFGLGSRICRIVRGCCSDEGAFAIVRQAAVA